MRYGHLLALAALLVGCGDPAGLRATPAGDGPQVYIDWDADPLPEVPFPNDLATRPDPNSPTGLRLNFSEVSDTEAETLARERVNKMTGFGIYAPISVRFRHRLDLANITARQADDYDHDDDAIYVINVDPDSPEYGEIVDLDFGHGRFPGDLFEPGAYFSADPRATEPSLLFDTAFEDCNRNGELDPGEDTDNDGVLDMPNIYPAFDPATDRHPVFCPEDVNDPNLAVRDVREDLMTWYEYETETLIFRPIVPMKEMTRYAVVLTDRLVDEAGNPVRSPWDWVNHTRQTEALEPLHDLLPNVGLGVENVAFAWVFTTGDITGELDAVRQGLDGQGPLGWLAEEFPASVLAPDPVRDPDGGNNVYVLPLETITSTLTTLGLFPSEAEDVLLAGYEHADYLVGGTFVTPDFLVDRDDAPLDADGNPIASLADSTDEAWELDLNTGSAVVGSEELTFTCVIPKERPGFEAPFPATFFGHGYGSSRFDFLGFAWAVNRVGHAACAVDFPGHGPTLSDSDAEEFRPILEGVGMLPFVDHLFRSRYDDLDNDQSGDSGADQWISDGFHTADMVRQAVVDWSQMIRAFEQCGVADWDVDVDGDGSNETSCDWNGDGVPDVGGADNTYGLMGGSLGGINAAVAAAVEPKFTAVAPIVAGAGFMDIGWRSPLSGVRQAVPGRVMSPFVFTDEVDGQWVVRQQVMSGRRDRTYTVANLGDAPMEGGQLRVTNERTGEVRTARFPESGVTRIGMPADAPDGPEKRIMLGMPGFGDSVAIGDPTVFSSPDNEGLGDRLTVEILDAAGTVVQTIDAFGPEVVHENVTYPAGSPLVALAEGLGHGRATPRLRRIVNVLALVTEKGDPVSYAPKYWQDPPLESMGRDARVLLYPTPGDEIVCVAAEFSLGRAAGLWDWTTDDERYGMPVDHWLIDTGAIRGDERFGPWRDRVGRSILFDVDNLDEFSDGTSAPSDAPLRAQVAVDGGVSGQRVPYVSPRGSHGWAFPDAERPFDINSFATLQAAWYIASGGTELSDDPCLESLSCDFLPPLEAR